MAQTGTIIETMRVLGLLVFIIVLLGYKEPEWPAAAAPSAPQ